MNRSNTPCRRVLRRARLALLASAFAAAATLLEPRGALADDPGGDTTIAQTLFEEGRRLMEAKQYALACPKFEESQRRRPGTGTLLNLALCNEALGKKATAWGNFKEVLFASKKESNEAREAFAQEHISALEPKLSKLQVDAESTPGLVIRRDGQEIPGAALGTPIPVDPGTHELEATAPGYSVWSTTIKVGDSADLKKVAIPKLTPAPDKKVESAPPPVAPAAPPAESSARRTAGFVVGGAGVAALGLGAVFGLLASGQASDAEADEALCPDKRCSDRGREAIDSASGKALVSTIGVGVGVAAVGAGVVLVLTSGSSQPAAGKDTARRGAAGPSARVVPMVGPGGGGAFMVGSF
jgi:hypothetical protein